MILLRFLYRVYLYAASVPLILLLYIGGWKKSVLRENIRRCGIKARLFRFRFYQHVALDFLRFLHGWYGGPIRARKRDAHKLKKLKHHSSIFLTAHFHHWEFMGAWMTQNGIPVLSAAKPMRHFRSQSLLIRLRARLRLATVHKNVPRAALRHLEGQGCFALLWDQRVPHSDLRAPFFGSSLLLDPLPAFLLSHRDLPVWFGLLLPNGTFRLLLLSRHPPSSTSPPVAQSPDILARRYHRVLEFIIRKQPTWWYGMAHRRFQEAMEPA